MKSTPPLLSLRTSLFYGTFLSAQIVLLTWLLNAGPTDPVVRWTFLILLTAAGTVAVACFWDAWRAWQHDRIKARAAAQEANRQGQPLRK